jgi:superoxide dismutase, Fe-Mn family
VRGWKSVEGLGEWTPIPCPRAVAGETRVSSRFDIFSTPRFFLSFPFPFFFHSNSGCFFCFVVVPQTPTENREQWLSSHPPVVLSVLMPPDHFTPCLISSMVMENWSRSSVDKSWSFTTKNITTRTHSYCFSCLFFSAPLYAFNPAQISPFFPTIYFRYVTNLNAAHDKLADAQAKNDVTAIIQLQQAIKFNGGGHLNHSIFWENLAPPSKGGGGEPTGELATLIKAKFGSFDAMKKQLSASTVAVQGSGWGWLGYDKATNSVSIATCPNQDPLQATTGLVPLFGIDVWEHAYYLDYKNVRPDYVNAIWGLANWKDVESRLAKAKK